MPLSSARPRILDRFNRLCPGFRLGAYRIQRKLYKFQNAPEGLTLKGGCDAETESNESYIGASGNWNGGGSTHYLRDGHSDLASGNGESGYRQEDRTTVRKVPYGGAHPEQLWEKVPREAQITRQTA